MENSGKLSKILVVLSILTALFLGGCDTHNPDDVMKSPCVSDNPCDNRRPINILGFFQE